jgi:hypothetical protein
MACTASDILRFLETIRQGAEPVVPLEYAQAMLQNQVGGASTELLGPGRGFGFGGAVLLDPLASGPKLERRAIQTGLRGSTLRRYPEEWIVEVEDLGVRGRASTRVRTAVLTELSDGKFFRCYRIADTLAERILTEPDVIRMLALEPDRRNQFCCGCCISPACACRRSPNSSGATCSRGRTGIRHIRPQWRSAEIEEPDVPGTKNCRAGSRPTTRILL